MLHRVDVHVINMRREFPLVADRVFPESPLPDAAFTLCGTDRRRAFDLGLGYGKCDLYCLPARRVVGVIGWQGPDGMHVVG